MASVSLREARSRLSELVRAAEGGQPTTLTRRGRDVARLEPIRRKAPKRLPDLSEFRASIKIKGRPLSDTVIAARREARY